MKDTGSSKPRRSHHRATQQGNTRVGVHVSVLKTICQVCSDVEKRTGKRLRPSEILDWLADAAESLQKIGNYVATGRPYDVTIDVRASDSRPSLYVVNESNPASTASSSTAQEPAPSQRKSPVKKQKNESTTDNQENLFELECNNVPSTV